MEESGFDMTSPPFMKEFCMFNIFRVSVGQVERQDVPLSNAWLCMHSGSFSLTFVLYQPEGAAETALDNGSIERMGLPRSRLRMRMAAIAPALDEPGDVANHALAVHEARAALDT